VALLATHASIAEVTAVQLCMPGPPNCLKFDCTGMYKTRARKFIDGSKFLGRRPEISEILEGSSIR
jgi:hypothetical protein